MPLLTRRSAILVAMESVYDTLPSFNALTDSLLIENPSYTPDIQILERNYLHSSLSRLKHKSGRKLAKLSFSAELTTTGRTNSGLTADAPVMSRLLRACGMVQSAYTSANVLPIVYAGNTPSGSPAVSWSAPSGSISAADTIGYVLTVTTGGGSGSARCSITPNDPSLDTAQTNVTLTSGSAVSIGSKGVQAAPTWTGNLVAGTSWSVFVLPSGLVYRPISTGFESCAMQFFVDGSLHTLTGCMGSFSISADAGNYGTIQFEMSGRYLPYTDAPIPAQAFQEADPPVFQLATLAFGTFAPVIEKFSFDIGTNVTPRSSANAADGYLGMNITARAAKGGIDPEATPAATFNVWDAMAQAVALPLVGRIGTQPGTRVSFIGPSCQINSSGYQDRNGIRANNLGLMFNQTAGDDEFYLCLN